MTESETETQYLIDTYGFSKKSFCQAGVAFSTASLLQYTEGHCRDVIGCWSRNDIAIQSACKYVERYGELNEVGSDNINFSDRSSRWMVFGESIILFRQSHSSYAGLTVESILISDTVA